MQRQAYKNLLINFMNILRIIMDSLSQPFSPPVFQFWPPLDLQFYPTRRNYVRSCRCTGDIYWNYSTIHSEIPLDAPHFHLQRSRPLREASGFRSSRYCRDRKLHAAIPSLNGPLYDNFIPRRARRSRERNPLPSRAPKEGVPRFEAGANLFQSSYDFPRYPLRP